MPETKKKKKRPSELQIQIALVQWINKEYPVQAETLAHFNNSGSSPFRQMWLTKAGVISGQPDLFLASPVQIWNDRPEFFHGLFLELKTEIGGAKPEQKARLELLSKRGYVCAVARGLLESQFWIKTYLTSPNSIVDGTYKSVQPRRTSHVWFEIT